MNLTITGNSLRHINLRYIRKREMIFNLYMSFQVFLQWLRQSKKDFWTCIKLVHNNLGAFFCLNSWQESHQSQEVAQVMFGLLYGSRS